MKRIRTMFAAVSLMPLAALVDAWELSGHLDFEPRGFLQAPAFSHQERHGVSLAAQLELYHAFDDDRQSLLFTPFLRLDSADSRRSHFDIRELLYQRVFDRGEVRAGIGRVFWGVTESYHLVDIINQTDLVENVDRKDKLGQPLVNLTLDRDWGVLDVFVLPGFRERTFPGREGRLRSEPYVDTDRATYESRAGRNRIDWAVRWSHAIGSFDIGVAHFHGTNREPLLLPECVTASCNPVTGDGFVLAPRYEVVHRTSLDAQATTDTTLWKLETVHESGPGDAYLAWVAGLEYTWYGIDDSNLDVGLLVEHLFDGRGGRAPQPLENDVFVATRLALNDEAGTDLLAGIIVDAEGDATTLNLKSSRRIGDDWKVELEALLWTGVDPGDPMHPLHRDDYVQFTFSRFF